MDGMEHVETFRMADWILCDWISLCSDCAIFVLVCIDRSV